MHFGFALELSDIDLWNRGLLDAHLDFLDTDIPSKYFFCLHNVFNTSSRHVFKTSWRRLQRNNFWSSKTSSRCLGRRKIVRLKTWWRRLQDQQMFPGRGLTLGIGFCITWLVQPNYKKLVCKNQFWINHASHLKKKWKPSQWCPTIISLTTIKSAWSFWLLLLQSCLICSSKVKLLSIMIPKSPSDCDYSL